MFKENNKRYKRKNLIEGGCKSNMATVKELIDIAPEEVTELVNKVTGQVIDSTVNSVLKIGDSLAHGIGNVMDDSLDKVTSYFSDVSEDNRLMELSRYNPDNVYIRPDDNTDKSVSYYKDGKRSKLKFNAQSYDNNEILLQKWQRAKSLFNFDESKLEILFDLIQEPDLILEFRKIQTHLIDK